MRVGYEVRMDRIRLDIGFGVIGNLEIVKVCVRLMELCIIFDMYIVEM